MQKTLAELEEQEVESYAWGYGVITKLSSAERKETRRNKICAICGEKRELTHEKLSGGVKSYICSECASDYVRNAERVKEKYGVLD